MNKLLTKIVGAALGVAMTVGVGVAVVANQSNVAKAEAGSETVEITASNLDGWNSTQGSQTGSYGGITIESNNAANNTQLRFYSGGTHTFTSSVGNITKAVFTCTGSGTGSNGPGKMSGTGYTASNGQTGTWEGNAASFTLSGGQSRVTKIVFTYTSSGGTPATYTGVTISEKTPLTGTYKGDAYYECQATVSGTGDYLSTVTWSITSTNSYGSGTSIANKASINNGKITFLDNATVYVWATAADETTHNSTGFVVTASGLQENPINSWTKITDTDDVSVNNVYALSNDKTLFASNSVSSNAIALTNSLSSIGYVVLEAADTGYYVRFATESAGVWSANGNYIKWANDSTKLSSTASPDSTYGKWNIVENGTSGVYLKNTSSNRHLGLNGSTDIRAYASSNLGSNVPIYLYEVGSLPQIDCAVIELTGKPSDDMSIGDEATLGYTAYDAELNDWTGDVVYSISNEKDPEDNTTTGVVELSATSGSSVKLTAKKAGSARVSVQDKDKHADADYVDVTVLADPERIDLPVGSYSVSISVSGSGKTIPASTSHEIKAKEGRTWYKNLVLNYTNVENTYSNEYTMAKSTGVISTTNNSNAIITSVEIDYFGYENATMYVGSTPVTSTAGTNTSNPSSLMKVYTINAANFSLKNEDASHAQSFYSLKINLEVRDESEEFLSLVVSKEAGWSTAVNGTYKEGQNPTNSGLVVTANYTTDGSTISRSEDVTSLVSNWAYTPSVLSTSDTSFNVVATWSGHDSSSFTVTGISVEAISSDIDAGRYFVISQSGNALDRVAVTSKECPQEDIISSASWTFTLVDDDTFTIHAYIGGSEKYLTVINDSQGLRTSGTSSDLWTVKAVSGGYTLLHKSSERYLCDYQAAGEQWRTYKSANAAGYNTITLTEEKEVFADNFLNTFTSGCNADGGYTAEGMNWTAASTQFATLSTDNQNVFKNAEYTKTGSGSSTVITPDTKVAKTVARYDYIVGKYGTATFADFMTRNPSAPVGSRINSVNSNNSAAIVAIVSVISLSAVAGFFLLRKRKEQ